MKRFAFLAIVLAAVCLSFTAQAATMNQIYVEIGTGDDDLRGGSQLILTLATKDGRRQKIELIEGRRLADRTRYTRSFRVSPAIELSQLQGVYLDWIPGRCDAPCMTDQWWITEFVLHFGYGPGSPSLRDAIRSNVMYADATALGLNLPHKFVDRNEHITYFTVIQNAQICTHDRECDDGRFCTGVERCSPGAAGADARGCLVARSPCGPGVQCNETSNSCAAACVDNDGDGHMAAYCGGDDCDDRDANRYPGNIEIADAADHDEDCDVNTHGIYRGASSTQICDGRNKVVLVDQRERFTRANCVTGTVCVQQPNGEGVCMPEPTGYQPPSAASLPSGPQKAPPKAGESKGEKSGKSSSTKAKTVPKDLLKDLKGK